GLLDIDVLAGLAGPDGRQRMPMVRGGDGDGIDILVVEDGAHVLDDFDLFAVSLFELSGALPANLQVGVDERGDFNVFERLQAPDVVLPAAIDAEHGNADGLIGAEGAGGRQSRSGGG